MCLNVMRGCLAHSIALDSDWNAFVDALSELTRNMKGVHDIEEVLEGFASSVSDAILHAMTTAGKYISQVR
jgi:glypican 5